MVANRSYPSRSLVCSASANWWAHIDEAPTCRTLPRRTASSSAASVSSIGVSSSHRWSWYKSIVSMPSRSRLCSSSCSIAFRESPPEFGFDSAIWKYAFVATTLSSRWPSSASPRTRSDSPFEYMLAVSKKFTPSSSARSTIAFPSSSSRTHSRQSESPKLIQPRQIFETVVPVLPSVVYSIWRADRGK